VASKYKIIIDDPESVAIEIDEGLAKVKEYRKKTDDSYYFNRTLHVPMVFQEEFVPTHENVAELRVGSDRDSCAFAAALRRLFSAIVWGNVKPEGVKAVEEKGPMKIHGDKNIMREIDRLLNFFAEQKRMRLSGEYKSSYEIVK